MPVMQSTFFNLEAVGRDASVGNAGRARLGQVHAAFALRTRALREPQDTHLSRIRRGLRGTRHEEEGEFVVSCCRGGVGLLRCEGIVLEASSRVVGPLRVVVHFQKLAS